VTDPVTNDRKATSRWLWAPERYLRLEAAKLNATPPTALPLRPSPAALYGDRPFAHSVESV